MPREVASGGVGRTTGLAAAMLALVLAAALAGCGGSGAGGHTGTAGAGGMMGGDQGSMHMGSPTVAEGTTTKSGTTTAEGTATTPAGGDGRSLFLASGCAGCHTLAAAGATGTSGPNLDEARPGYARVVRIVTDGSGSMPAFAGTLDDSQIRAVARFVAGAAG